MHVPLYVFYPMCFLCGFAIGNRLIEWFIL